MSAKRAEEGLLSRLRDFLSGHDSSADLNEEQNRALPKAYFQKLETRASDYEAAAETCLASDKPKKAVAAYQMAREIYETIAEEYNKRDENKAYSFLRKAEHARRRAKEIELGGGHNLEGRAAATAAIVLLAGSIFFSSSSLAGNVIGNFTNSTLGLNQTSSNWIGGILFVIGLGLAFIFLRKK